MPTIRELAYALPAFSPDTPLNQVAECFLGSAFQPILSAPVVADDGRVLGTISRYQLNEVFLKRFGRDLYGARPVTHLMARNFLQIDVDMPVAEAATYITQNMRFPLSEDFIVCEQGRYLGVGAVLKLLAAMERHMQQSARDLARAYRELKASQAQLVQSEKMASLGQMVAGVAHEINTPLGYVKNNVLLLQEFMTQLMDYVRADEVMLEALLDPDCSRHEAEQLRVARDSSDSHAEKAMMWTDMQALFGDTAFGLDQINELVLSLKNFSRTDQAPVAKVSLNDCVSNALLIARHALKSRIEVIKSLGVLPLISCAPSQINQVILNIVTNAAQAIEGQGRIVIKTWAEAETVNVSIQDNGKGMPPEVMKRIFDPFFTTKPVGEGTGLGLSICWQIMQQHGGRIRVASEPGRGTRFLLVLPCTSMPQPVPAAVTMEA